MSAQSKNRGVGYRINIVAMALGIVGLICYLVSGEDKSQMTETFVSASVYVPFLIAIILNGAGLFFKSSIIKIFAFAMYFLTLAMWILTQAGFIVNVVMGIDNNTFSFAYILSVICMIAPMVLSLVSLKSFKK